MTRAAAVRPEEIRRHNLSLLLRHIHQHGERTRADLTAAMGLNRSTIGALVSDLVALGLVTEYVPAGRDRAGRPSHVVAPRRDGPYVVAADVAVDRVVTAAVGLGGAVLARRETTIDGSQRRPAAVIDRILADAAALAGHLRSATGPVAVGISVPGAVRQRDGFVEHAPNLNWRGVAFASMLADAFGTGIDVHVGNDADLGAVAEHQRGVAVGCDNLIYLTGTVGVGAGIIAEGIQLHGVGGYAGEIGHMTINPDGWPCHCGSTGCIETYIGDHALLRAAGMDGTHGPVAVARLFREAAAGAEPACGAVHEVARWLGRSLANIVNCFNPQLIVVGGSLAEIVRIDRPTVEHELDRRAMRASRAGVELTLPALAQDSPLIGAAELAFQTLLAAPDSPATALTAN